MKKVRIFAVLAAVMLLASCAPKEESFRIKRGTNLSHWLSQTNVRGAERKEHIQEDDFQRLHELGFDHVRIPIDEVQFWDEDHNQLPQAWELLDKALDWARKYELRVIVDLHIIRAHYFNAVNEGGDEANDLFTNTESQEWLVEMWRQLSDFMKNRSTSWVAYEMMNEPVAPEHEQWNEIVQMLHKSMRALEPERVLVIGSNMWQGHWTMKYLRLPENDPNIILSFHYYNPQLLTHRGAPWTPAGHYEGPITYPGVMISEEDYAAAPDSVKPALEEFRGVVWNKDKIREQMADAIAVAERYGVQLFCGEWGVYEPVDRELAYAWTKDMLEVFDEYNIAWTTWCYDADFGFWDQKAHDYKDKQLVELLMNNSKGLEE